VKVSPGVVIQHGSSSGSDGFEMTSPGSAFDVLVGVQDVYGQYAQDDLSVDVDWNMEGCQ